MVTRAGIDADDSIRRSGLRRQRRKGPGEEVAAVVGDHDSGDSYFLKN